MGRKAKFTPTEGTWFDLDEWLSEKSLISRARRAGLCRLIPVGVLDIELSKLVERRIVSQAEVDALLSDLREEGYLDEL